MLYCTCIRTRSANKLEKNSPFYSLPTNDFVSADPSRIQDACHINSVKMTSLSMSSCSSVDRAPNMCSGRHGFDSCQGLKFSFVPCSCHVDQFTFHELEESRTGDCIVLSFRLYCIPLSYIMMILKLDDGHSIPFHNN